MAILVEGDGNDDDQVWLIDSSIGFRFPKRRGIASIGVKNLFDKEFKFADFNFNTGEPLIPLFQPERTIFAQITFSF